MGLPLCTGGGTVTRFDCRSTYPGANPGPLLSSLVLQIFYGCICILLTEKKAGVRLNPHDGS